MTPFEIFNYDMREIISVNIEKQLGNNYVQNTKKKLYVK